jgi:hypothetical protein
VVGSDAIHEIFSSREKIFYKIFFISEKIFSENFFYKKKNEIKNKKIIFYLGEIFFIKYFYRILFL